MLLCKAKVTPTHHIWWTKNRWQKHSSTVQLGKATSLLGSLTEIQVRGDYWIRLHSKAATYPKPHSWIGDNSHKPHLCAQCTICRHWTGQSLLQEEWLVPKFFSLQQVFNFSFLERSHADLLSFSIRVFTSWILGASFLSLGGNVSVQSKSLFIRCSKLLSTYYGTLLKQGCGRNWERNVSFLRDINRPLTWDEGRKLSMQNGWTGDQSSKSM